jgi:hypothetical protein
VPWRSFNLFPPRRSRRAAFFGRADRGGGIGLRLQFNKHSKTNLALDHGWGETGSKGWFLATTEKSSDGEETGS